MSQILFNSMFCSGGSRIFQRGAPSRKERHQPIIWPKFAENWVKMKKIGRGVPKFYYVDPPLLSRGVVFHQVVVYFSDECPVGSHGTVVTGTKPSLST